MTVSDQELVRRLRAEFRRPPSDGTADRHVSFLRASTRAAFRAPGDRANYQLVLAAAAILVLLVLAGNQLGPVTAQVEPLAIPGSPTEPDGDAAAEPVIVTLPPPPPVSNGAPIDDPAGDDKAGDDTEATPDPAEDLSTDSTPTTWMSATSIPSESEPAPPPTTAMSATSSVLGPMCGQHPATIVGTNGDDVLKGTDGDDVIVARDGNDKVYGGGGNDVICGGRGDDLIRGGAGDDRLWGGNGGDTLHGDGGADRLGGGGGNDVLRGGGGPDRLSGQGGDDDLDGQWGDDVYHGGGQAGDRCVDTINTGATVVDCY